MLALGLWWLPQGPIALVLNSNLHTHPVTGSTTHILFIPITVNAWHALFHALTALAALTAARRAQSGARSRSAASTPRPGYGG
jgi:hypothetical protein